MKKKKKLKLRMDRIVILAISLIIIAFLFTLIFKRSAFKVTMKSNSLNVGEEYKNDFTATLKGKDVTSKVEVKNNIYNTKIGKYQITFIYRDGNKEYKVVKKISIEDKEKPEIILTGGSEIIVLVNTEFKDPGYIAKDNCDGNITDKIKIEGKVDTTKEGTYLLTYTVLDSKKNKASIERKVIVSSTSPMTMSIKDFTLKGYFKGTILEATDNMGEEYLDSIVFAGDSMALYYVINHQIYSKKLWHRESIDPEKALTNTIYINHQESGMTFIEAFKKHKPPIVIMTLGTNSVAYMDIDYFISSYKILVEKLIEASPETKLIIQSIPPVDKSFDTSEKGLSNDKINKFNYRIAQMCSEVGIPFLNSAVAMKDKNGQCKEGYCNLGEGENGVHPTRSGNEALVEYTKTHALID